MCGDKGHIVSQCPSQQVNTMLKGDSTIDEEPVDEEIEMEVKNANTRIREVIAEHDEIIDMLSL